jgi:hypothetical protein
VIRETESTYANALYSAASRTSELARSKSSVQAAREFDLRSCFRQADKLIRNLLMRNWEANFWSCFARARLKEGGVLPRMV